MNYHHIMEVIHLIVCQLLNKTVFNVVRFSVIDWSPCSCGYFIINYKYLMIPLISCTALLIEIRYSPVVTY